MIMTVVKKISGHDIFFFKKKMELKCSNHNKTTEIVNGHNMMMHYFFRLLFFRNTNLLEQSADSNKILRIYFNISARNWWAFSCYPQEWDTAAFMANTLLVCSGSISGSIQIGKNEYPIVGLYTWLPRKLKDIYCNIILTNLII